MPEMPDSVAKRASWQAAPLSPDEFNEVGDSGTLSVEPGENEEAYRMEVGEDGRLSAFRLFWLGEEPSEDSRDSRGKFTGTFKDDTDTELPRGTQVRFVRRLKTESKRDDISRWYDVRALNEDRKEFQEVLPPATNDNDNPVMVTDGELIVMEIRHPSQSITLGYNNTFFQAPGYAGA